MGQVKVLFFSSKNYEIITIGGTLVLNSHVAFRVPGRQKGETNFALYACRSVQYVLPETVRKENVNFIIGVAISKFNRTLRKG